MKNNGIDKTVVLSYLSKIFSQMVFIRGYELKRFSDISDISDISYVMYLHFRYIHCDPHPGNVMVQKVDGTLRLVLLDHGLYQTLTDEFRITYCKLWQVRTQS